MGLGPHVHRAFSAFSLIGMYEPGVLRKHASAMYSKPV